MTPPSTVNDATGNAQSRVARPVRSTRSGRRTARGRPRGSFTAGSSVGRPERNPGRRTRAGALGAAGVTGARPAARRDQTLLGHQGRTASWLAWLSRSSWRAPPQRQHNPVRGCPGQSAGPPPAEQAHPVTGAGRHGEARRGQTRRPARCCAARPAAATPTGPPSTHAHLQARRRLQLVLLRLPGGLRQPLVGWGSPDLGGAAPGSPSRA